MALLFIILMFLVFGAVLKFAIRATWGILKLIVGLVILPILFVVMVFGGLLTLAVPLLILLGIVFLVKLTVAK